ncbi:hypothetical protein Cva_00762 [Caedimonas varicaedens]|uniref:Uncharacterized protein n=1 Tax=Caedimonas varicaedens TaxID=1629334 RepID=A0A0K8ME20_9PROT|nr:hypothetical protein Cva_00762 [Caedimonas varicaedens]
MNPLVMMQLMAQMQQGGTQPAQGMGLPSVMPQGQQQSMPLSQNQTQPSFEQMMSGYGNTDPMSQLMMMQPQSSSILDEGALSAIKSAKTALKMDDEEKTRLSAWDW